jgi:trans-aconitate methyltransferase
MVSFGIEYSHSSTFQDQMWCALARITEESISNRNSVTTLLDLGCGTGLRTRDCFRVFPELQDIVAIDNDYSMIREAIRTNKDPRIKFTTLDIMRFDTLVSRKFDAITSNWALHWIFDKDSLFESLNLVSQPGCFMLIGTCERLPSILYTGRFGC